jgi:2-iminobutanoate/2-iminopropanoate deaminase
MADSGRSWQPVMLPADVPRPVGPYTPAVRAGDLIFVSGQVPRDPRTGELAGNDFETQARKVLENVRGVLAAAGATMDDVVSTIVYLTDVDDWGKFNEVYKEFFRAPFPTRTAVGAQLRGIRVEVSAVAYRPRS